MAGPIRILCLEDDPVDVELITSTLIHGGLDVELTTVDTRDGFSAALDGSFDVILADYSLPAFDGISALELVRERDPWIGFILVSGALGRATAIEALKAGATDYVFKDDLSRLTPAVERALRESRAVAERSAMIDALIDSEQRYRDLVENSGVAIVADDRQGHITFFNERFSRLFGYPGDALVGMTIWDLIHPDDREAVRQRHERRYTVDPEADRWYAFRGVRGDGETIHLEINTNPQIDRGEVVGSLSFIHDVSNQKRLEAQLAQAQKLEALGQLAGGIAHDFNNLLTSIMGSADLLALATPVGGLESQELTIIRDAVVRGAELTQRLLAIARQQVLEMELTDLDEVVANELEIMRRVIPENIRIFYRPPAEPPTVMADRGQIGQVLMNLLVNARDAMPDGGEISISLDEVDMSADDAHRRPGVFEGRYGRLTVRDTGVGMDAVTLAHVFEPFFTTKSEGLGTGIGLATVYGIVKQHRGFIEVESAPGEGACFEVYLPTAERRAGPDAGPEPRETETGDEKILVVEDETNVRLTMIEVLKSRGYTVIGAANGREALELLEPDASFDLVVSDVVMPEMGGEELLARARERCPGLVFLFSSGYTDESLREVLASEPGATFIAKPFTIEQLSSAVRGALTSGEAEHVVVD